MENSLTPKQDHLPAQGGISNMPEFQPPDESENLKMPRLILMQDKSPEVDSGVAKKGDLLNSLSKENYGSKIEVIPLVQMPSSRIRWKARSQGGGILCIARDGQHGQGDPGLDCVECPFYKVHKGQGPQDDKWCSYNYQIVALVRDTKEPILLTADSVKPSDGGVREMVVMARMAAGGKGIRLFGRSYILSTMEKSNAMGKFFVTACVPKEVLPAEEVQIMEEQMKFFSRAKVEDEVPFNV